MKNLLYKEFRLSVHPLTYAIMALFALVCLSPGIPSFVPLVYFGAVYTFLFIGMNKTTTTNDLFYTCNLPLRRQDVVKARVLSISVLQLVEILIVFPMLAINKFLIIEGARSDTAAYAQLMKGVVSLGITHGLYLFAAYLICFSVFDLIYLPWFYKTGKSIIGNMLTGILVTAAVGSVLTIVPYFIKGLPELLEIGNPNANYLLQVGCLLFGVGVWIGSRFLVNHLSTKNLVKLDF